MVRKLVSVLVLAAWASTTRLRGGVAPRRRGTRHAKGGAPEGLTGDSSVQHLDRLLGPSRPGGPGIQGHHAHRHLFSSVAIIALVKYGLRSTGERGLGVVVKARGKATGYATSVPELVTLVATGCPVWDAIPNIASSNILNVSGWP